MIRLIAAVANNWAIGKGGGLPFDVPEDLAHFKRVTMGCDIVMGRTTFESLPGILPGRRHLVLTRTDRHSPDDRVIYYGLPALCAELKQTNKDVYIIGGAEVYSELHDLCDELLITHINLDCPDADVFFPKYILDEFIVSETTILLSDLAKVVKYSRVR